VGSINSSNQNGASVGYTYDDLNRLGTVVDNRLSGNNTTTYAYDPASNLATATYPNGVQGTLTYDTLNRLTGFATQNSGYTYQRGPTGNLTSATESNGRTVNWSYDDIYRLTNEVIASDPSHVNGSVAYGLDPVGNRLSDTSSLAGVNSGSFGYNSDDELNSETYDNNGNTLSTGGKNFTYDPREPCHRQTSPVESDKLAGRNRISHRNEIPPSLQAISSTRQCSTGAGASPCRIAIDARRSGCDSGNGKPG
jgi:YD repeat-containing protein